MDFTYQDRKALPRTGERTEQGTGGDLASPNSARLAALSEGAVSPAPSDKGRRIDLNEATRARMERAFGADLSAVKLYESRAVADAGANAVARGGEIAFAPGRADFSNRRGQELLGHELSHVMSQRRGEVTGGGFLNDRALESRADREGAMAAAGQSVYGGAEAPLSAASAAPAAGPMQASRDRGEAQAPVNGQGLRNNVKLVNYEFDTDFNKEKLDPDDDGRFQIFRQLKADNAYDRYMTNKRAEKMSPVGGALYRGVNGLARFLGNTIGLPGKLLVNHLIGPLGDRIRKRWKDRRGDVRERAEEETQNIGKWEKEWEDDVKYLPKATKKQKERLAKYKNAPIEEEPEKQQPGELLIDDSPENILSEQPKEQKSFEPLISTGEERKRLLDKDDDDDDDEDYGDDEVYD